MYERVVQLRADVPGEFGGSENARRRLGDIDGAEAVVEDVIDGRFDPLRFEFQTEGFAQHKHGGKNRAQRAGNVFSGESRRRTVNRFVERGETVASATHGRNQADRAGERGRFVTENIAKHVAGENHVELRRIQQELHRGVVDV